MIPEKNLCRLCVDIATEGKSLYDDNGRPNELYEITHKYFHPKIVNLQEERHLKEICLSCWRHICEFHSFETSIVLAQLKLIEEKVDIITTAVNRPELVTSQEELIAVPKLEPLDKETTDAGTLETPQSKQTPILESEIIDLNSDSDFDTDDELPLAEYVSRRQANKPPSTTTATPPTSDSNASRGLHETLEHLMTKWMPKIKCIVCLESYPKVTLLREHFRQKHSNEDFYISCCSQKLSTRRSLKDHLLLHNNPNAFKCSVCDVSFSVKSSLKIHMLEQHPQHSKFVCKICGQRCKTKSDLKIHYEGEHKIEPKPKAVVRADGRHIYPCSACDKICQTQISYYHHFWFTHKLGNRSHEDVTDQRNVEAPNAVLGPGRNLQLQSSYTLAQLQAKYLPHIYCRLCPQIYTQLSQLQVHFLDVHPREEFYISCCFLKLSSHQEIRHHLLKHTDNNYRKPLNSAQSEDFPYACRLCHKKYKFKEALDKHTYKIHRWTPATDVEHSRVLSQQQVENDQTVGIPSNRSDSALSPASANSTEHRDEGYNSKRRSSQLTHGNDGSFLPKRSRIGVTENEQIPEPQSNLEIMDLCSESSSNSSSSNGKNSDKMDDTGGDIYHTVHYLLSKWLPTIKCVLCPQSYSNLSQLEQHFFQHHPLKKFYIFCCSNEVKLTNRIQIRNHLIRHVSANALNCKICGRTSLNKDAFVKHRKRVHPDHCLHPCEFCGANFYNAYALKRHLKFFHRMFTTTPDEGASDRKDSTFSDQRLQSHEGLNTTLVHNSVQRHTQAKNGPSPIDGTRNEQGSATPTGSFPHGRGTTMPNATLVHNSEQRHSQIVQDENGPSARADTRTEQERVTETGGIYAVPLQDLCKTGHNATQCDSSAEQHSNIVQHKNGPSARADTQIEHGPATQTGGIYAVPLQDLRNTGHNATQVLSSGQQHTQIVQNEYGPSTTSYSRAKQQHAAQSGPCYNHKIGGMFSGPFQGLSTTAQVQNSEQRHANRPSGRADTNTENGPAAQTGGIYAVPLQDLCNTVHTADFSKQQHTQIVLNEYEPSAAAYTRTEHGPAAQSGPWFNHITGGKSSEPFQGLSTTVHNATQAHNSEQRHPQIVQPENGLSARAEIQTEQGTVAQTGVIYAVPLQDLCNTVHNATWVHSSEQRHAQIVNTEYGPSATADTRIEQGPAPQSDPWFSHKTGDISGTFEGLSPIVHNSTLVHISEQRHIQIVQTENGPSAAQTGGISSGSLQGLTNTGHNITQVHISEPSHTQIIQPENSLSASADTRTEPGLLAQRNPWLNHNVGSIYAGPLQSLCTTVNNVGLRPEQMIPSPVYPLEDTNNSS